VSWSATRRAEPPAVESGNSLVLEEELFTPEERRIARERLNAAPRQYQASRRVASSQIPLMIDMEYAQRLALAKMGEYERLGSPALALLTDRTRVLPEKVSVTKAIRHEADMGLAAAKAITDAVLRGESAAVPVRNWATAIRLAEDLQKLGAEARPSRATEL